MFSLCAQRCASEVTRLLLLGRLRRSSNEGRPRLLSAEHFQNLLRSPRPGVGLVWVRLHLLARGAHVGLCGLSGLGLSLIVGVFVGLSCSSSLLSSASVVAGCAFTGCRVLRGHEVYLAERLTLGKAIRGHRHWIVLIDVRGGLGLSRRRRLGRKDHARNRRGIRIRTDHHIIERGAVEQSRQNVAWRSRAEVGDHTLACARARRNFNRSPRELTHVAQDFA